MYALALLMSAATVAATTGIPYFHLGSLDLGLPIQAFGVIVAVGLIIGSTPLRRYAEWHGVSDENIRSLMTWILISGFLGAHEFDMVAYNWDRIGVDPAATPARWWPLGEALWPSNWPLPLRIWDGISSYGGFIGGAIGFALFAWWKRLPARLFADITMVGLLPAFSIGRLGCTVVSDHIGAMVEPDGWYAFLAQDYPRHMVDKAYQGPEVFVKAWNLGLLELLYLIPVNIIVLWLAFRPSKRQPAGFLTVLTGVLYAPVRFFLDFLRPEDTDPRYAALTFAQWSSILAFVVAVYAARRILQTGEPGETIAPTSREAQERLRVVLREDDEIRAKQEADKKADAERKRSSAARAREREREDAEAAAAERGKAALAGTPEAAANEVEDDDEDDAAEAADEAQAARPSARPAAARPAGKSGKSSASKKRNKRKR